jgi:hypothetical protein
LLDGLPNLDDFLVPHFVGAGPSAPARAHVAELPEGGPPPAGAQAQSGGTGAEGTPPQDDADFERAVERALRSRHVPPDETPFVRRWFEVLAERRR